MMDIQSTYFSFQYDQINKEERFFMDKTKLSSIVLAQLSLEQYIPLFHQAGIDFDSFVSMTDQDFISIGLKEPSDLDLLSSCAKALKAHIAKQTNVTISEEEEDLVSLRSSNSSSSDTLATPSSSTSTESILRAIHAYDSYYYRHEPTVTPMIQRNTSSGSLVAPPGTVIRRNKPGSSSRPLSMPIQLPSYTPPPDYTLSIMGKRLERCQSMIIPREEEGKEELPGYTCTVFKMGYVHVKREFDAPNVKSKWRTWRKLYIELWGTMLRIYRTQPSSSKNNMGYYRWPFRAPYYYYQKYYYTPILTVSLAGAEASRALDYFRRPNVLRLTTQQGPQFLMKLSSHVEMISWIEHLQAAINISLDLEQRPMPKFITIPTRGLATGALDPRSIELERAREQRRRDQREVLI